jgi:hypothetical protein
MHALAKGAFFAKPLVAVRFIKVSTLCISNPNVREILPNLFHLQMKRVKKPESILKHSLN